jgi:hypothetical protein
VGDLRLSRLGSGEWIDAARNAAIPTIELRASDAAGRQTHRS